MPDPYEYDASQVADPPTSLFAILRRIGPGMILAASIVGSGELIATTNFGAEVGYAAMWIILLSCVVKVAVQSEIGRYTIATGQTGLAGLNQVPGPRAKVSWIVWLWALMVLMTLFQIGAMFGGVAQVMNSLFPAVPEPVWVLVLLVITLVLLLGGGYERIERLATIKVGLFTMLTFLCALLMMSRPEYFTWARISEGLKFNLPSKGLASAITVFGITGVGATELFMYPYWCVEKGYARFTGPRDGTPEWEARARGWIRVMQVDILASMVIYTVATVAFYLLGAGILHNEGLIPGENQLQMIAVLSNMYTRTLGPWSVYLFYLGAIATLYGTIFAATAANSRVYADMFRLLGLYERGDYPSRLRYRRLFVWLLTVPPVLLVLALRAPVSMVKVGGVAQAMMLPVIAAGVLYLRYRKLPKEVTPSSWHTVALWIASVVIMGVMAWYAYLSAL